MSWDPRFMIQHSRRQQIEILGIHQNIEQSSMSWDPRFLTQHSRRQQIEILGIHPKHWTIITELRPSIPDTTQSSPTDRNTRYSSKQWTIINGLRPSIYDTTQSSPTDRNTRYSSKHWTIINELRPSIYDNTVVANRYKILGIHQNSEQSSMSWDPRFMTTQSSPTDRKY